MKKALAVLLAISLLASAAYIIGCSDDDDEVVTGPTPGDPNDPVFKLIDEIVGQGIMDYDGTIIDLSFMLADYIPGKKDSYNPFKSGAMNQLIDSMDLTYNYTNFWHTFTFYIRIVVVDIQVSDTLIYQGTDSLRFGNASGPMQYMDSTTTSMNIRAHVDADISSLETDAQMSSDVAYDMTLTENHDLYINGTSNDTLDVYLVGEQGDCQISGSTHQTASNLYLDSLTLESEGGCPQGGKVTVLSTVDLACVSDTSSLDFTGNWTVTVTFNGGMMTLNYNNGTNVWEVTVPCGGGLGVRRGWAVSEHR